MSPLSSPAQVVVVAVVAVIPSFQLRPLQCSLLNCQVHPPAQHRQHGSNSSKQQTATSASREERNSQETIKTYVALQGALEDELISHLCSSFLVDQGRINGGNGVVSFFTVPLCAGSQKIVKKHNAETGASGPGRNSGNFCAAENRVGRRGQPACHSCHSQALRRRSLGAWCVVGLFGLLPPWRFPPVASNGWSQIAHCLPQLHQIGGPGLPGTAVSSLQVHCAVAGPAKAGSFSVYFGASLPRR